MELRTSLVSSIPQCAYETKGYPTLLGQKSAPPHPPPPVRLSFSQTGWKRGPCPTLIADLGKVLLTPA